MAKYRMMESSGYEMIQIELESSVFIDITWHEAFEFSTPHFPQSLLILGVGSRLG
jgi:hypothetical protein